MGWRLVDVHIESMSSGTSLMEKQIRKDLLLTYLILAIRFMTGILFVYQFDLIYMKLIYLQYAPETEDAFTDALQEEKVIIIIIINLQTLFCTSYCFIHLTVFLK